MYRNVIFENFAKIFIFENLDQKFISENSNNNVKNKTNANVILPNKLSPQGRITTRITTISRSVRDINTTKMRQNFWNNKSMRIEKFAIFFTGKFLECLWFVQKNYTIYLVKNQYIYNQAWGEGHAGTMKPGYHDLWVYLKRRHKRRIVPPPFH